jgi:hypothetical protein
MGSFYNYRVNSGCLTGRFVLVKESRLFHPMSSWVPPAMAYGFVCLNEDGLQFFDKHADLFKKIV